MNYLRVTEIIKPFSGVEFVNEQILQAAADRGTRTHDYIEAYLCGFETDIVDEDVCGYLKSFKIFWEDHKHLYNAGIRHKEMRLNCDKIHVTGQIDFIVEINDRTYLLDWKTSSKFQKSWYLQGAAYRYLAEQNGFANVDNVLFVKLNKDGSKPSLYKSEEHEKNLEIFFKCLDLYKFFEMDKTRKVR